MLATAASVGLLESDFWAMTPAYFFAYVEGFNERYKSGWEQTRFGAYVTAKTVDSKNRLHSPQSLIRFPWERVVAPKFDAEARATMQKFDADADEFLKQVNPEAYERYMAGKAQKQSDG